MEKEVLINRLRDNLKYKGIICEKIKISKDKESNWSYEIKMLVSERNETSISEKLFATFRPEITKEEWNKKFLMAISGDGQELRRITTLHSSSLLALLFFCHVSKSNPIEIEGAIFDKVYFEVKNKVFKNADSKDKPSNVDIMLVSKDNNTILFLESKFTEYAHNGKVEVSEKYFNFYSNLCEFISNLKFSNGVLTLKEGRNSQYIYGIKQMFSHLIGLLTEPWKESSNEIKELIQNAQKLELGSVVFNWDQSLYEKYSNFYNDIFQYFNDNSDILNKCLDDNEVYKDKINKVSILTNILSYQDLLKNNPSFIISEEIKSFYSL